MNNKNQDKDFLWHMIHLTVWHFPTRHLFSARQYISEIRSVRSALQWNKSTTELLSVHYSRNVMCLNVEKSTGSPHFLTHLYLSLIQMRCLTLPGVMEKLISGTRGIQAWPHRVRQDRLITVVAIPRETSARSTEFCSVCSPFTSHCNCSTFMHDLEHDGMSSV